MADRYDDPEVEARIRRLSTMALEMVHAEIDGIPGVAIRTYPGMTMRGFDIVPDFGGASAALHSAYGFTAVINLDGWGPGLHARRLTWRQNLNTALRRKRMVDSGIPAHDADAALSDPKSGTLSGVHGGAMRGYDLTEIVEAYRQTLSYVVTLQRMLARTAHASAYDAPLPADSQSPTTPAIGHLSIPIPLLDLMLWHHGSEGTVSTIRHCVRQVLQTSSQSRDDALTVSLSHPDIHRAGMTGHLGVPAFWCEHPVIGGALFDGTTLALPLELPEIIQASAPGRRIGEITTTGIPRLDAATIDYVGIAEDGNAEFDVSVDSMLLRDHPAIRPHL